MSAKKTKTKLHGLSPQVNYTYRLKLAYVHCLCKFIFVNWKLIFADHLVISWPLICNNLVILCNYFKNYDVNDNIRNSMLFIVRKFSGMFIRFIWYGIQSVSSHGAAFWFAPALVLSLVVPLIGTELPIAERSLFAFLLKWFFPVLFISSLLFNYVCDFTRVEAGSNTSTVNLRVVRGDEMGLKKAAP
jgi:hypothetical protein